MKIKFKVELYKRNEEPCSQARKNTGTMQSFNKVNKKYNKF